MCGVLSGNRNFEGRIHPLTRANYLASPLLVIAYALAGTVDIDFEKEPIGETKHYNFYLLQYAYSGATGLCGFSFVFQFSCFQF